MQRRAAIEKPRPRSQAGFFAASNCYSKIGLRCLPLFVLHRGVTTYPKPVAAPAAAIVPWMGGLLCWLAEPQLAWLAQPAFATLRRGSLHSLRERRLVGGRGIEPLTPSMSRRCSSAELTARSRRWM